MVKKRIISVFTYKAGVVVKSLKFGNYRNVNTIIPTVKLFNKKNIDEMIFLNLDENIDFKLLESFINEIDYPITYGGGIKNIETIHCLFKIGFDKVSLNSILYTDVSTVIKASKIFGKQSIVASIDVKKINNEYYCFYNNGKINSMLTIEEHITNIINSDSISEIIVTSIDNDGTFVGFDEELYKKISNYNIKIIANGGGNYDENNIIKIFNNKNIYGLIFSSLFFFKQYTPTDIKNILNKNNISYVNHYK